MLGHEAASCNENNPCRHYAPCAKHEAALYLTRDDWEVIGFYRTVADQVDGMNGMPRMDWYERMARLQGQPEDRIAWLIQAAAMLHRLVAKQDPVNWILECGKSYRFIGPEDVDGDPD